jgi:hypothetical protein
MSIGSAAVSVIDVAAGAGISSATPISFTLNATSGLGTNIIGANLQLAPGRSTGLATSGDVAIQRVPTTLGSGSANNTRRDAIRVVSKSRTLTNSTATAVVRIAGLGAHDTAGGTVVFSVRTSDGTDDGSTSGEFAWAFVNTTAGAGGETCTASLLGTNATASSAGVLTVTADTATGTDSCDLRLTSTQTVMTPTTNEVYYTVISNSRTATVTPQ